MQHKLFKWCDNTNIPIAPIWESICKCWRSTWYCFWYRFLISLGEIVYHIIQSQDHSSSDHGNVKLEGKYINIVSEQWSHRSDCRWNQLSVDMEEHCHICHWLVALLNNRMQQEFYICFWQKFGNLEISSFCLNTRSDEGPLYCGPKVHQCWSIVSWLFNAPALSSWVLLHFLILHIQALLFPPPKQLI